MNNFISVSNISNLHKQIRNSVNLNNIFNSDEDSVKYLINIMNDIYSKKSFINNIHILNENTLNTYINSLLPEEYLNEESIDTENNIIPIENKPEIIKKNLKLLIDSKNNNNKNNYTFNLPDNIKNIISIELESAKIPKSQYIINKFNNKIFFQEKFEQENNNTFTVALLDIGNYNIEELKSEVEDSMNILGDSKYTFHINKKTNRINIESNMQGGDKIFNLKFEQNLFGFNSNFVYTNKNKYLSEKMFNLDENNILNLFFKNIDNSQPFGTLFMDCNQNKNYFYTKNKYSIKYNFDNKKTNLDKLEICFKDEKNNDYEFNNVDHTLLLNIEYTED